MVRALASHHCGRGSIAGPGVTCGLSLLLVLVLAPRVFLRVLRFSSLHKNQHAKFQFDLETDVEPPRGRATAKSHYIVGYTLRGPTYIESFYHFWAVINVLNYNVVVDAQNTKNIQFCSDVWLVITQFTTHGYKETSALFLTFPAVIRESSKYIGIFSC